MTFTIDGALDHPRWYDIPCTCDHSHVDTEFPIKDCKHCQFQMQEDSMPKKSFELTFSGKDENDEDITVTKTINKIKIVRGEKYQDIIGWSNVVED